MTKEHLSSDRINYLIWRYLQELNYLETAVKLQQEWNIEAPETLDFAPHVKQHALVAVLHRGLLYHETEREIETQQQQQQQQPPSTPIQGFFGPLPATPVSPSPHAAAGEGEDHDAAAQGRKRQGESKTTLASPLQNGAPQAKRPKLSNGLENGSHGSNGSHGREISATTPMDLDDHPPATVADHHAHNHSHAYPSPKEVDRNTPAAPLITIGPEHGTQVDKVRELAAETTFLPLHDDLPSSTSAPIPILLHCAWSPRDASILVAAGTDGLARLWTVSRTLSATDPPAHVNGSSAAPYRDLAPPTASKTSSLSVSALDWSPDGNLLALAAESNDDDVARVGIWAVDGTHLHTFEGFVPPIIALRWNPSNTLLLGLMPEDNESTLVKIFHPSFDVSLALSLPQINLFSQPLDVAWISDTDFVLCGAQHLLGFRCTETSIEQVRKFEVNEEVGLLKDVVYDWRTRTLATSRDTGVVEIWDIQGQLKTSITAHQGTVVSLQWQPSQAATTSPASTDEERLLATSGVDGTIKIWSIKGSEAKSRVIDMKAPVVSLAFTPDGAFLAGATSERILIWKVEDVTIPRASWSRGSEPGWLSPRSTGSTARVEDEHSLSWDANGQRLAYGVNSQLAVIDFRR